MSDLIYLRGTPKELKLAILRVMAMRQLLGERDVCTAYPYTPAPESTKRKGHPKVTLHFLEDSPRSRNRQNNPSFHSRRKQRASISFRLMHESTQPFTKASAILLAMRIKEIFGAEAGFIWRKGKTMYSYCDWDLGYQLQLLCISEFEARRVVTAALAIQNHIPEWTRLNTIENVEEALAYPENPGTQIVMAQEVAKPLTRPNVKVRFQYASVSVKGMVRPQPLYDRGNRRVGVLVR